MQTITDEDADRIVNRQEFEICSYVISNSRKKALWKLEDCFLVEWHTKVEGNKSRKFNLLSLAVLKYNSITL